MRSNVTKNELDVIVREIKDLIQRKKEAEEMLSIATGVNKINWYCELESINSEFMELTYRKEEVELILDL